MKVKVVHGLPLSGKSTYVRENIKENSLVYDYDRLDTALTYNQEHTRQKGNAHRYIIAFRNTMLRMLHSEEKLDEVWVITSNLNDNLKKDLEGLDVEYIHLDVSKEELLDRLENDDDRPDKEEWKKAIEELSEKKEDEEKETEKRMAITNDREYRSIDLDVPKDNKDMIVEGTAVVFDTPTVMYEVDGLKYYEIIERGALDEAKIDDVVLNIDHVGKPAAKTRNNTLELTLHDDRLDIRADLSKNATGRELHEDIVNGFYEKMSFSFTIADEEYDRENRTRIIKKIDRLYDVSAVTVPAYNQTSIIARSFFSAEAEKELVEARELELRKRKLQLQIRLRKDGLNE